MVHFNVLVYIGMAVSDQKLAWFDEYLACGCTTSYDTPIFNASGWKGVRAFLRGRKKYNVMEYIVSIVDRTD